MIHVIAERWADKFSVLTLVMATSALLVVLAVGFAVPRIRNNPSIRIFLSFPGLLLLWWFFAFCSPAYELVPHHHSMRFIQRLAIDLATFAAGMFVIVRLDIYLDKRKNTKGTCEPGLGE